MNAASPVQTDDQKGAGSLSDSEADLGPNFESLAPQKGISCLKKTTLPGLCIRLAKFSTIVLFRSFRHDVDWE